MNLQQKKFKIVGIGNSIIDLLCVVDEQFLHQKNLTKSSMSLIDEKAAEDFSALVPQKISCGGSVANTIATIAYHKIDTEFFGIIGNDNLGKNFIGDLQSCGSKFIGKTSSSNSKTATSFILIAPDASRTMCTFLGCASEFYDNYFDEETFIGADIVYIEGYLWDGKKTIAALRKAISLAKKANSKIAFTLSDKFCVQRHKDDFLDLLANQIDILFANESEILEIFAHDKFSYEEIQKALQINQNLTTAITRGEKGCVIFYKNKVIELPTIKINNVVDTTGAGDCFAAGFLSKLSKNSDLVEAGKYGNFLASEIIQKIGARFDEKEILGLLSKK